MSITCKRCGYKRRKNTDKIGFKCPICHVPYPERYKFSLADLEAIPILISLGARALYIIFFLYISVKALIDSGIGSMAVVLLIACIFFPVIKKLFPYNH